MGYDYVPCAEFADWLGHQIDVEVFDEHPILADIGKNKLFGNFPKRISVLKPEQVDGSFKKRILTLFFLEKQKRA